MATRRIVSYRRRCPGGSEAAAAADPGKCKTVTLYIYLYIDISDIVERERGSERCNESARFIRRRFNAEFYVIK